MLLFRDVEKARRFMRRHRDEIVQVIVVGRDGGNDGWKGAIKSHYGAVVLSGLILLQEQG